MMCNKTNGLHADDIVFIITINNQVKFYSPKSILVYFPSECQVPVCDAQSELVVVQSLAPR